MPGARVSSVQLSPPSVVFQMPLFPPPASIDQGVRWNLYVDAYSTRGFDGSIVRSFAPVESSTKSTFCQLFPPSVVRKTPRSGLGPKAWPMAETYTRSASRGSTTMSVIWCVSASPSDSQVAPASVERYIPVPKVRSSRSCDSPLPT